MLVWACHQNSYPGFHQYSPGLLQLAVLRHSRWFDEPPAVSSECCRMFLHWSQTVPAHHASPRLPALAASPQTSGFQDIHSCLSFVGGTTPVYLADECTLVTATGRLPLQSADNRTCLVKRSQNQFGDHCFATAGPVLWNSFGNWTSPLDNSNDCWKRLCLVCV